MPRRFIKLAVCCLRWPRFRKVGWLGGRIVPHVTKHDFFPKNITVADGGLITMLIRPSQRSLIIILLGKVLMPFAHISIQFVTTEAFLALRTRSVSLAKKARQSGVCLNTSCLIDIQISRISPSISSLLYEISLLFGSYGQRQVVAPSAAIS